MNRKPLIFSAICILTLIGLAILTWLTLPDLDRYPIHWNLAGEADRFASRNAVLAVLMIMPITQIAMAVLLYFLPKIEPLRQNFEESRAAYNTIWIVVMAFLTIVGAMICLIYKAETALSLQWLAFGISLVFIGIGNVLGKVRQNYLLGIRTPWTLSSELSWEKTHRVGSRLFVLAGIIGLLLAVFIPEKALAGVIVVILVVTILCVIYSYIVWKEDPQKRS